MEKVYQAIYSHFERKKSNNMTEGSQGWVFALRNEKVNGILMVA